MRQRRVVRAVRGEHVQHVRAAGDGHQRRVLQRGCRAALAAAARPAAHAARAAAGVRLPQQQRVAQPGALAGLLQQAEDVVERRQRGLSSLRRLQQRQRLRGRGLSLGARRRLLRGPPGAAAQLRELAQPQAGAAVVPRGGGLVLKVGRAQAAGAQLGGRSRGRAVAARLAAARLLLACCLLLRAWRRQAVELGQHDQRAEVGRRQGADKGGELSLVGLRATSDGRRQVGAAAARGACARRGKRAGRMPSGALTRRRAPWLLPCVPPAGG